MYLGFKEIGTTTTTAYVPPGQSAKLLQARVSRSIGGLIMCLHTYVCSTGYNKLPGLTLSLVCLVYVSPRPAWDLAAVRTYLAES